MTIPAIVTGKKILICMDKFRGSLSAAEACEAVRQGIHISYPQGKVKIQPLADGGEGTYEILAKQNHGDIVESNVEDPLGRPITARYAISKKAKTAYIDMSAASGLSLLAVSERNPMLTSTYGTGQLIAHALENGAEKIVLCIGGSATNDAGAGMAAALGFRFLDNLGEAIKPTGGNLSEIAVVLPPEKNLDFDLWVACDVDNPLYGPQGAAAVYGPQKGASPAMVSILDLGLRHFASLICNTFGLDPASAKGAGAAGGLGYGTMVFLKGKLLSGIDLVIRETGLERSISHSDIIITGEGSLDDQTLHGKAVSGIAALAKKHNKPLLALCGTVNISPEQMQQAGITRAAGILDENISLHEAMADAFNLLKRLADNTVHRLGL